MIDLNRKELILQFFSLLTQDRHVLVSCLPETLNLSHEASSFKKRVEDTNTHTHQSKTKKRKERKKDDDDNEVQNNKRNAATNQTSY